MNTSKIGVCRPVRAMLGAVSLLCMVAALFASAPASAATAAPTISSFSPTKGKVGTPVTITGTGFTGTTSVLFDLTPATFKVVNDTTISTSVPTGATTGHLHVRGPAGRVASTVKFKVLSFPPATLSPTSGPVGTAVTITGTGFTGATSVLFDQTSATFKVVSDTKITTTVPAGATTGYVHVKVPGHTDHQSTVKFTVT